MEAGGWSKGSWVWTGTRGTAVADVDVVRGSVGLGAILTKLSDFDVVPLMSLEAGKGIQAGLGGTTGVSTLVGYTKGNVGSSMIVEETFILPARREAVF